MGYMVKVTYKNKELQPVNECVYTLDDYTELMSLDIKKVIADMEDMVYKANGGQPKEEWDCETLTSFNRAKHKLLDKAGDISRLPEQIYMGEPIPKFWDGLFRKG